jgi:hypothetical protein
MSGGTSRSHWWVDVQRLQRRSRRERPKEGATDGVRAPRLRRPSITWAPEPRGRRGGCGRGTRSHDGWGGLIAAIFHGAMNLFTVSPAIATAHDLTLPVIATTAKWALIAAILVVGDWRTGSTTPLRPVHGVPVEEIAASRTQQHDDDRAGVPQADPPGHPVRRDGHGPALDEQWQSVWQSIRQLAGRSRALPGAGRAVATVRACPRRCWVRWTTVPAA